MVCVCVVLLERGCVPTYMHTYINVHVHIRNKPKQQARRTHLAHTTAQESSKDDRRASGRRRSMALYAAVTAPAPLAVRNIYNHMCVYVRWTFYYLCVDNNKN